MNGERHCRENLHFLLDQNALALGIDGLYIRWLQRAAPEQQGQKSKTPKPKLRTPIWERIPGRYRSGQTGQTVNLLAYAFSGSNPLLPIPLNENDLDQCQQQKFQVVIFDLVALKLEFTPLEDAYFL